MVNVAVLGYGTIGSGVVEVLQTNTEIIAQRAGEEIAVKYILDLRDFPGDPNADKVVHDFDIIDKDEDVQVVVECMGGVEPACAYFCETVTVSAVPASFTVSGVRRYPST